MSSNENNFYIGQVVKCIKTNASSYVTRGRTYIIVALYNDRHPYVETDLGRTLAVDKRFFKPVKERRQRNLPSWF